MPKIQRQYKKSALTTDTSVVLVPSTITSATAKDHATPMSQITILTAQTAFFGVSGDGVEFVVTIERKS